MYKMKIKTLNSFSDANNSTSDYKKLDNKPSINGVVLEDDKTLKDLGIENNPIKILEAKEGENLIYYQNDVRNNNLDDMYSVAYKAYYLKHPLVICRNDTTRLFEAGNVIMVAEYSGLGDVNVDDILYGFEYDYRLSMLYMDFERPGKATRYDKISTENFESTGKQYFYTKAEVDTAIQNAIDSVINEN